MKHDYEKINIIYEWSRKIKGFIVNKEYDKIKNNLLKECHSLQDEPIKIFSENYSFPSEASREIAKKELDFIKQKFSLLELLDYIHENMESLRYDNIVNVIFMLSDIALYHAYRIIDTLSYGGLYYQLNMCIVLDAMKIKPDNNIDISSILKEVSSKAIMNIDMLDISIIWAIAMLNYKMHVYNMAISFFEKYLIKTEMNKDKHINEKRINAKIYIGYCNEKAKKFTIAIEKFEQLLVELEGMNDNNKIIIELHHGLGHFYNERAIFENAETKDQDILKARLHMKKALAESVDYSSCYGSLYHEYGDYENAQMIFEESAKKEDIINNEELAKELQFYIGQTYSAKVEEQDAQIEEAERNLNEFEDYCKRTFNNDGIVHARIFKIRTRLRNIGFTDNITKCKENRKKIERWYKELKDEELSNYASREIKSEYWKTICILNIFRVLYADDNFTWHKEDILFYLKEFIGLMPINNHELDYVDSEDESKVDKCEGNLYKICLDGLWIWCVGSKMLPEEIKERKMRTNLEANGIKKISVKSVINRELAHRCIHGNGKPDLVVLIPPQEKDIDFENEVNAIMCIVSESYFFYAKEISVIYDSNWLQKVTRGIPQRHYSDILSQILPFAYCFRALEILRRELLQPIPLFSLAPTHFSSSYDFQLGEELEILPEAFSATKANTEQKKIRKLLEFVDSKYSSNLLGRHLVNLAADSLGELCCMDEGIFAVCFPRPENVTGQDDNYISYVVKDRSFFDDRMFIYELEEGKTYTIKALSSYKEYFWELEGSINDCAKECEIEDKHVCCNVSLSDKSEISTNCKKILQTIFGKETSGLDYQCRCILKKLIDNGKEKNFIYIIFGIEDKNCTIRYDKGKESKMNPTVFVTYAWKPEGKEFKKYQKEVYEFTNTLLDNGFDAAFDLSIDAENWTQVMVEGLQRDKIIVLLSPEYKHKADKTKDTGVSIERNAILERLKSCASDVIFAKLPSQKDTSWNEITPIIFSGAKVIDLSKDDPSDGYNMLFTKLMNEKFAELHTVAANHPKTKKMADI